MSCSDWASNSRFSSSLSSLSPLTNSPYKRLTNLAQKWKQLLPSGLYTQIVLRHLWVRITRKWLNGVRERGNGCQFVSIVRSNKISLVTVEQSAWPRTAKKWRVYIDRVQKFKYLGVVFDENLSWEEHIKRVHSKSSSRLYLFKQIGNFLDTKQSKIVFTSLVQSIMDYADTIWSPNSRAKSHHIAD